MASAEMNPLEGADYTIGRGGIKVPILTPKESAGGSPEFLDDYDVLDFFRRLWGFQGLNTPQTSSPLIRYASSELVLLAEEEGKPLTVIEATVRPVRGQEGMTYRSGSSEYTEVSRENYLIRTAPQGPEAAPFDERVRVRYSKRIGSGLLANQHIDKVMFDPFSIQLDGENLTYWDFIGAHIHSGTDSELPPEEHAINHRRQWSVALQKLLDISAELLNV